MTKLMNRGHQKLALWGLTHFPQDVKGYILDIGCGGGRNMENLHQLAPESKIWGVDYSETSVEASKKKNQRLVEAGKMMVFHGTVEQLPFDNDFFDGVTAFETIYFWPGPKESFDEVFRVLQSGGTFLICNEACREEGNERWIQMIDMKIYSGEELKELLQSAGFQKIEIHHHSNGKWMCVTAIKP